ncbi:hypothetical protein [Azospirillum sp. ST 5-10]|uniref:hypothetical protein n=1 Tax=unclassified Azospirillum TaxID=2630922 RepID=UPI003F49D557
MPRTALSFLAAALTAAVLTAAILTTAAGPAAAQAPLDLQAPVDLSLCQYMTAHRPAADVEYVPGVDVHGRPVAPADLPGSAGAAAPLDRFEIPVTLGFLRRMGVSVPRTGLPGGTEIGTLVLDGGRLSFNGRPLDAGSEGRIYAFCRSPR